MSLKEIKCQDNAVSLLQHAFSSGRMAHAWIFAGIDGVGKCKTALEWSKMLFCEAPVHEGGFTDSCGQCRSCRLCEAGSHPDLNQVCKELREYTSEGKGKAAPVEMPIDVIREFLIDKSSSRPSIASRRIFIVSEAETLNSNSQNALLKILEEPPSYCIIILLCSQLEGLLPTTRSRCQIVRFGPVSDALIADRLSGAVTASGGLCEYLAGFAQGSVGEAMTLAELENNGAAIFDLKRSLLDEFTDLKYSQSLDLAQRVLDESKKIAAVWSDIHKSDSKKAVTRRSHKLMIRMFISFLQDAMYMSIGRDAGFINTDQLDRIKLLSSRFSGDQLAEKLTAAGRAIDWIDSSVNEKLIFERLLLNLAGSDTI